MATESTHDRIAKRAYERYLARLERNESGDAESDWFKAMQDIALEELRKNMDSQNPPPSAQS